LQQKIPEKRMGKSYVSFGSFNLPEMKQQKRQKDEHYRSNLSMRLRCLIWIKPYLRLAGRADRGVAGSGLKIDNKREQTDNNSDYRHKV
jgi:hypothetical protein